jgi:hypothetical protein
MINLKDHEAEFNGRTYVPFEIAEKAVVEAFESSKAYKKTSEDLKQIHLDFKEAMKELGEGFDTLSKTQL